MTRHRIRLVIDHESTDDPDKDRYPVWHEVGTVKRTIDLTGMDREDVQFAVLRTLDGLDAFAGILHRTTLSGIDRSGASWSADVVPVVEVEPDPTTLLLAEAERDRAPDPTDAIPYPPTDPPEWHRDEAPVETTINETTPDAVVDQPDPAEKRDDDLPF